MQIPASAPGSNYDARSATFNEVHGNYIVYGHPVSEPNKALASLKPVDRSCKDTSHFLFSTFIYSYLLSSFSPFYCHHNWMHLAI